MTTSAEVVQNRKVIKRSIDDNEYDDHNEGTHKYKKKPDT